MEVTEDNTVHEWRKDSDGSMVKTGRSLKVDYRSRWLFSGNKPLVYALERLVDEESINWVDTDTQTPPRTHEDAPGIDKITKT